MTVPDKMLSQTRVNDEQTSPAKFNEVPAYVARRRGAAKDIANALGNAIGDITVKGVVSDALLDPGCYLGRDNLYAREHQAIEGFETKIWMMMTTGMCWESPWRRARLTP